MNCNVINENYNHCHWIHYFRQNNWILKISTRLQSRLHLLRQIIAMLGQSSWYLELMLPFDFHTDRDFKCIPPSTLPANLPGGGKSDTFLLILSTQMWKPLMEPVSQFTWPWGSRNLGKFNDLPWVRQLAGSCWDRDHLFSEQNAAVPAACFGAQPCSWTVAANGGVCTTPLFSGNSQPSARPPSQCS